jgi:hypothetical protein
MRVVLDMPFADLRPFLGVESVGPDWKVAPDVYKRGFLRGIGGLRKSRDVGAKPLDRWATEAWYVDATGLMRLAQHSEADFPRISKAVGAPVRPGRTFRRIWSDGGCVWHVQLGLDLGLVAPASFAEVRALVGDLVALSVHLRHPLSGPPAAAQPDRWEDARPLLGQAPRLAAVLQAATTRRKPPTDAPPRQLVQPGTPLIYLETTDRRRLTDPDPSTYMPGTSVVDGDARRDGVPNQLHYYYAAESGATECAFVWVEAGGAAPSRQIGLRLNLQRLHAEREVLKVVLRSRDVLAQPRGALEIYLSAADALLKDDGRYGNDQAVLKSAFAAYDNLTAGEREAALASLATLRQTRARAERLIDQLQGRYGSTSAARAALLSFLSDAFTSAELRMFVKSLEGGDRLARALPGDLASLDAVADEVVDGLYRFGLVAPDLFVALKGTREHRGQEIDEIEGLFRVG